MDAGRLLAHVATRRARRETRFAAHFLCLTVFTVAVTAFVFALDYRTFYAQWHAPVFTYIWCLQQIFTMAGASYQFLVIGVPLFFRSVFRCFLQRVSACTVRALRSRSGVVKRGHLC